MKKLLLFVMLAMSVASFASHKVVFAGSFVLGYDGVTTVKIPASSFASVAVGDMVTMVVAENLWCKMMKGSDWSAIKEENAVDKKCQFEVTEELKSSLQTSGLLLQGSTTLQQVYFGTDDAAIQLYDNSDGFQIEAGWANGFTDFNDYDFSKIAVGDVLTFGVECTATEGDWHPLVIQSTDDYDQYLQYNVYGQTTLNVVVDAALQTILLGNCRITGDQFKLKSIEYAHTEKTYVLNATDNLVDLSLLPATATIELTRKYDWNTTLCLPFDVENVSSAFGASTRAYEFKEYAGGLVFTERESLKAGVPYFMTFDMTGISEEEKTMTKSFTSVTVQTALNPSAESKGLTFKGNYTPGMDMQDKYGVACVQDGDDWVWAFFKGGTNTKLNAFSAYFDGAVPAGSRLAIVLENEATGIAAVRSAQQAGAVYNLNGQRVACPVKGLYIKEGKKVMVK